MHKLIRLKNIFKLTGDLLRYTWPILQGFLNWVIFLTLLITWTYSANFNVCLYMYMHLACIFTDLLYTKKPCSNSNHDCHFNTIRYFAGKTTRILGLDIHVLPKAPNIIIFLYVINGKSLHYLMITLLLLL